MSEKYEGLNLPQLLDLMHDIVMPESVAMTPQTDGWLVVAGWSAAVAALAAIKIAQRRRRNRYRRDALAELDRIDTNSDTAAGDIASIVKRPDSKRRSSTEDRRHDGKKAHHLSVLAIWHRTTTGASDSVARRRARVGTSNRRSLVDRFRRSGLG